MDKGTEVYLDLLKKVLTNVIYMDPPQSFGTVYAKSDYDEQRRVNGEDWPLVAHTMVGLKRLDNLQYCVEQVLADDVPGDFIETGVWRGGACIFMRALLNLHGVTDRTVWVADSFQGIPETDETSHPGDRKMALHKANDVLAISMEQVRENFSRYGLLDEQVEFLPGWFRDTLPAAPVKELAIARLDGDLYESTMDALESLYPKLAVGGFLIIDDFIIPACAEAVHEYRAEFGIEDEMVVIDDSSVYWRRTA
jgi:hypothetical protein